MEQFSKQPDSKIEQLSDWRELKEQASQDAATYVEAAGGTLDEAPSAEKCALLDEVLTTIKKKKDNTLRFAFNVVATQLNKDKEVLDTQAKEASEAARVPFPDGPDYPVDYTHVVSEPNYPRVDAQQPANENYPPPETKQTA